MLSSRPVGCCMWFWMLAGMQEQATTEMQYYHVQMNPCISYIILVDWKWVPCGLLQLYATTTVQKVCKTFVLLTTKAPNHLSYPFRSFRHSGTTRDRANVPQKRNRRDQQYRYPGSRQEPRNCQVAFLADLQKWLTQTWPPLPTSI